VRAIAALLVITLGGTALSLDRPSRGEKPDHSKRAELLASIPGSENGRIGELTDEVFRRAFPGCQFSTVRFRQYPVARVAPAPLKHSTVIVEASDGPARTVVDDKGLESFFRTTLAPVRDEAGSKDAVRAWLLLSEELHQDGFFRFTIPSGSITVSSKDGMRVAQGKFVVAEGGKGEISVSLTFDAAGKLTAAKSDGKIIPGVRPICQATKLLDPDPIVRRMAEQDILVMGRAAEEYLNEQRSRATPELRQAIDRIWARICDEGW
jgi:hypothetical protein